MLKVGLLGYGKMGKTIDAMASDYGVVIIWRIGREERPLLTAEKIREADVVIEFSRPEAGLENVLVCLEAGVPVVSGTTGWQQDLGTAASVCREKNGAFLWASNFSVGVNLFFAVNQYLAGLMASRNEYNAHLTEIHHIHKLDAPSGTAVSIAEGLISANDRYRNWSMELDPAMDTLPVAAIREGEVPGTHIVRWSSPVDEIVIEHKAHARTGFAGGALLAAKWLAGRKGVYNMKDVLGLGGGS